MTPHDLVALLERAFSFAVLALLFRLGGVLLHGAILCGAMGRGRRAERAAGIRARFAINEAMDFHEGIGAERNTAVGAVSIDLLNLLPIHVMRHGVQVPAFTLEG